MQIEKLKKKNLLKLFNHLKNNFKKKHILYKSMSLFDWQYKNRMDYNFYILKIKSTIMAAQGFIPTSRYDKLLKNDAIFLSIWSSSGVSIGSKLFFSFIKKVNYKIMIGLGGSKQSFLFQNLLNFNCGYMKHFFLSSDNSRKELISPKNFSNYKFTKEKKNYKQLLKKEDILNISKNLFNYQIPKKTPKYILNRYFNHPYYKYYIYEVSKNLESKAIYVFRVCKFKKSSAVRIVDYIGSNKDFSGGKHLFNHLLDRFSSDFIDIYFHGIPDKYLISSGLENVEKYKFKKLIIPNYFEPFVKKNIKLSYAFKSFRTTSKRVRLFKGDSDLDRPNILN